jgi:hypothetical protein
MGIMSKTWMFTKRVKGYIHLGIRPNKQCQVTQHNDTQHNDTQHNDTQHNDEIS